MKSLTEKKSYNIKLHIPEDPKNFLDWELKHENSAGKAYYKLEGHKHSQLSLVSRGFMMSKTTPTAFTGASPDNFTSCKCMPPCKGVVVENKCPWSHQDLDPKEVFLTPEIGGVWQDGKFSLKENSRFKFFTS